ncbi:MAG: AbrB/MazE/SpoVT family DNA-binding domain-containing protein [Candidatus Thermoplasmatota archaeon]|jgi:phosphate uptake regulator|nr:AbrB/MazE/SpoVT family DNA-binding domain-containing protein [Candidatus Thermoplasmatota archaeon]MCL5791079.1 AbrB/MazE/SpoVT family DNA-binding domain-containing protein [Candidatus Thermoplasmatota archaeon]
MTNESRRVQLTGGSTFIVSLPQEWIRKNGMGKGSLVTMDINGDNLTIYPGEEKKKEVVRTMEISSSVTDDFLQRSMISIYISGFDTLIIKSSTYLSQGARDVVKKFTRLVMGVEIFEESARSIVLQNVLDSSSFPLSNALKRMIMNVQNMFQDTIKAVESNEIELIENIISRDDEVDRYHFYIMKEIGTQHVEGGELTFYLIFSRILERIADHSVNICISLKNGELNSSEKKKILTDFMRFTNELLQKSTTAFMGADLQTLNEIVNSKDGIKEIKSKINQRKFNDVTVSSITEEITRIGLYLTDIAEITMDRYIYRNQTVRI